MTRAERKAARNAKFAADEAIRKAIEHTRQAAEQAERERWLEYAKTHPVSAGLIPVETYREPRFSYTRSTY